MGTGEPAALLRAAAIIIECACNRRSNSRRQIRHFRPKHKTFHLEPRAATTDVRGGFNPKHHTEHFIKPRMGKHGRQCPVQQFPGREDVTCLRTRRFKDSADKLAEGFRSRCVALCPLIHWLRISQRRFRKQCLCTSFRRADLYSTFRF